MREWYTFVLIAGACAAPTQGSVFFTFDDAGSSPNFAYFEGSDNTTNPGFFTYKGAPMTLDVDGTEEGLGSQSFVAQLQMNITIGAVVGTFGDALGAPVLGGFFSFVDTNADNETILGGILTGGGLFTLRSVGLLVASSKRSELFMGAGPALDGFLGGQHLAPTFDISFLLQNIFPFVNTTNANNFLTSFSTNSFFTGRAELVPTPGAYSLFGLGAMALSIRRRRNG